MGLYDTLGRKLLFRLDPERAHELGLMAVEKGLFTPSLFWSERLVQTLFGVRFPNPLGLAAGFDKNAVAVNQWHQMGFGHVELGTITWHGQPGNPKPRLFRLPEDGAVINRMGFNNYGARVVAARLKLAQPRLVVGVNLGKSKVTELEDAPADYAQSFEQLRDLGAYFVLNVSSPNTPGLRTLQGKGPLLEIIAAIQSTDPSKPLFVKVAPDLEPDALDDVIAVAHETNLTGLIATNTSLSREGLKSTLDEAGGLSGRPLRERADRFLAHIAQSIDDDKVLIGVGGVFDGEDAYRKIRLGAHLVQTYTGFVYGGPTMPSRTLRELDGLLARDGHDSLATARKTLRTIE